MRPMARLAPFALVAFAGMVPPARAWFEGLPPREALTEREAGVLLDWWLSLYPLERQGIDVVAVSRPELPPLPQLPTADRASPAEDRPSLAGAGLARAP